MGDSVSPDEGEGEEEEEEEEEREQAKGLAAGLEMFCEQKASIQSLAEGTPEGGSRMDALWGGRAKATAPPKPCKLACEDESRSSPSSSLRLRAAAAAAAADDDDDDDDDAP